MAPTWPEMERQKFLDVEAREVHRFIGFAPYDGSAEQCARLLGEAGLGPKSEPSYPGFLVHRWHAAAPCSRDDAPHAIPQIADYLAFRVQHFREEPGPTAELEFMMLNNVHEALGVELQIRLDTVRAVRADNRMMPHEWLMTPSGKLLKTDGHDHGDDHFFPGPCDVAWDIAGAIIEWSLDEAEANTVIARYTQLTGDRVKARLPAYLVAYLAFRVGYVEMALASTEASERTRLGRASTFYRHELTRLLHDVGQPGDVVVTQNRPRILAKS